MALSDFETQLIAVETETNAKIRGWARVSTHSLLFYPDFAPAGANFCKEKVQRLTRVFDEEGCHRQNTSYCIPGNIDESDLQAALRLSEVGLDDLQRRDDPPRVFLPVGRFVRCAYGSSRINALEETRSVDHWWTIALYTGMFVSSTRTQHANEDKTCPHTPLRSLVVSTKTAADIQTGTYFPRYVGYILWTLLGKSSGGLA